MCPTEKSQLPKNKASLKAEKSQRPKKKASLKAEKSAQQTRSYAAT
jgi:hypothetical protein